MDGRRRAGKRKGGRMKRGERRRGDGRLPPPVGEEPDIK